MAYDTDTIRKFFPILKQEVYGKPLIYFDNAATTLKPVQVLMSLEQTHNEFYGNIHRAVHYMASRATDEYEKVRELVRHFINAESSDEIIFTKGTTESVNLVASTFGEHFLTPGNEIIVSEMEHHSNIVPWQINALRKGAAIVKLPVSESGELQTGALQDIITHKTKLIAVTHVSNVLGTVNPISQIVETAHRNNVPVFVDGAQAVQHLPVDVQALNVDFYAFSAHKMYGPNGVGVLYGKRKWLEQLPPYQGGGEMISEVSFEKTTFSEIPYKFEAGTPNIAGVIAFGEAIKLLQEIGFDNIIEREQELLAYATRQLKEMDGLRIYGEAAHKSGVISFNVAGIHPFDLGTMLDKMGVAVRTGSLCADPLMDFFDISGTVRISFGIYNTKDEVDRFILALRRAVQMLS